MPLLLMLCIPKSADILVLLQIWSMGPTAPPVWGQWSARQVFDPFLSLVDVRIVL